MEPPPSIKYSPFNQPKPPSGTFEWSDMSAAFEVVKSYTLLFMAFTLICGIGVGIVSQISTLPLNFVLFNNPSEANWGPLIAFIVAGFIVGYIVQSVGYALILGGTMTMGVQFIRTKVVEFSDGFSVIRRILSLTLGFIIPYLVLLPLSILQMIVIVPMIIPLFKKGDFSPTELTTFFTSVMGIGCASAVITFVVYSLCCLTIPAMIVNENLSAIEAAKISIKLTKSNLGSFILLHIVFTFIMVASALLCYIPLLFTIPWYANTLLLSYCNIAKIDLTGQFAPQNFSPYPRELQTEMPAPPTSTANFED